MQKYCGNCGESNKKVGKLIGGKCFVCRMPEAKNRAKAIWQEKKRLEERLKRIDEYANKKIMQMVQERD